MKLINIFFLIALLLCLTSLSAQNTTMAKAYLSKAETALYQTDYKKALSLIEKCKDELNGSTNPEIIYVEVKARSEYDKNITLTKELINQFINEAFDTDVRVSELADLLIDLETSDDFFTNGQRKTYVENLGDGDYNKYFFQEDGIASKIEIHENYELMRIEHYFSMGDLSKIDYFKYDKIINSESFYAGKLSMQISYFNNGQIQSIKTFNDDLTETIIHRDVNDYANAIDYILENEFCKQTIYQDLRSYSFMHRSIHFVSKTKGNDDFLDNKYWLLNNACEFYKNGLIKTLKYTPYTYNKKIAKEYIIVDFDENGIPIRKEKYDSKGVLDYAETYNSNTGVWVYD